MDKKVTLPVQFCRKDSLVLDFCRVRENWDIIANRNMRWRLQDDPIDNREFELDNAVSLPTTILSAIPKTASLTRDVLAGVSALYLLDRPESDILRGKLPSRILELIGMSYNGRSYDDVCNVLRILSLYTIHNQPIYRFDPKTKQYNQHIAITFRFMNDFVIDNNYSCPRQYQYDLQVNRIYADMLTSRLPRATIPREVLVAVNSANSRIITPAKNVVYALAASYRPKRPLARFRIADLNRSAGYRQNKPNKMAKQVDNILKILPRSYLDYEIKDQIVFVKYHP